MKQAITTKTMTTTTTTVMMTTMPVRAKKMVQKQLVYLARTFACDAITYIYYEYLAEKNNNNCRTPAARKIK